MPEHFTYPGAMPMGWMDVYNPKAGIGYYYANQDVETRLMLLRSGAAAIFQGRRTSRITGPRPPMLHADEPIGLTIGWVNLPYVSHGTFTARPRCACRSTTETGTQASGIYRAWFDRHFTVAVRPIGCAKKMPGNPSSSSNSEDVVVHRFNELPQLAADAKKYGITTFEILGWDIGGIDRGYPQYTPDPRLGTPEEFRKALADIRAIGVHPLIFSNVDVADTARRSFRSYSSNMQSKAAGRRTGPLLGWGEGTISARAGLTPSNMTLVSPAHPEFRKLEMDQYLELVRDGRRRIPDR